MNNSKISESIKLLHLFKENGVDEIIANSSFNRIKNTEKLRKKDLNKVTSILDKNAVHYDELGTISKNELYINDKTKVTIDELKTSNKNWLIDFMSK